MGFSKQEYWSGLPCSLPGDFPTLCVPMDCDLPGSSVHGILQARILEWVAMPSSRGFSRPRDQTCIFFPPRFLLLLHLSPNQGLGTPVTARIQSLCATNFMSSRGRGVKNPPAVQEMQVPSLGWEDPLEEEMATHSSILAWKIPWTEEPGGLQCMRFSKSWTQLSTYTHRPIECTTPRTHPNVICGH